MGKTVERTEVQRFHTNPIYEHDTVSDQRTTFGTAQEKNLHGDTLIDVLPESRALHHEKHALIEVCALIPSLIAFLYYP